MRHTSVKKVSGKIDSTEGNPIRYDLYTPSHFGGTLPVVMFLHGFKGFKDWGAFPDAFYEMVRSGCAVLAFNFSRNGIDRNTDTFERLDLFEKETFSQDLLDVQTVINALHNRKITSNMSELETERIAIVGHSRGGHTAVVAAADFTEIDTLITWSAVADYEEHFTDQMKKDWEEKGYTEIVNSRTKQTMKIDRAVYDDLVKHRDQLIALNRVKKLTIPCCFIHGSLDETVPVDNTQRLFEACPSKEKERILINNADHTYGCSHPWEVDDLPAPFSQVIEKTVEWLETYFIRHNV